MLMLSTLARPSSLMSVAVRRSGAPFDVGEVRPERRHAHVAHREGEAGVHRVGDVGAENAPGVDVSCAVSLIPMSPRPGEGSNNPPPPSARWRPWPCKASPVRAALLVVQTLRGVVGRPTHSRDPHSGSSAGRLNSLRAGVLGADDGIVSVAGIVIGVAGPTTARGAIFTAGASAMSFVSGAVLTLLANVLPPASLRAVVTFVAVLAALALTGAVSARLGGSDVRGRCARGHRRRARPSLHLRRRNRLRRRGRLRDRTDLRSRTEP